MDQLLSRMDGQGRSAAHITAMLGNVFLLRYIGKQDRASLSRKDIDGNTPLHLGVMKGQKGIVEALVDMGIDVSIPNNDSKTALDMARALELDDIAKLLEQAGKPKPIEWGRFEHILHIKGPFGP